MGCSTQFGSPGVPQLVHSQFVVHGVGTGVQRYRGTEVQGYRGTEVQRYRGLYRGTEVQRVRQVQVQVQGADVFAGGMGWHENVRPAYVGDRSGAVLLYFTKIWRYLCIWIYGMFFRDCIWTIGK